MDVFQVLPVVKPGDRVEAVSISRAGYARQIGVTTSGVAQVSRRQKPVQPSKERPSI
jgi:hypothetical protein